LPRASASKLCAMLANHAVAGVIGARLSRFLSPTRLDAVVGISHDRHGTLDLKPDRLEEDWARVSHTNVFLATFVALFIAQIGDRTQIATVALAAAYPNLLGVIAGTTTGIVARERAGRVSRSSFLGPPAAQNHSLCGERVVLSPRRCLHLSRHSSRHRTPTPRLNGTRRESMISRYGFLPAQCTVSSRPARPGAPNRSRTSCVGTLITAPVQLAG
jgi:hypothetical protein